MAGRTDRHDRIFAHWEQPLGSTSSFSLYYLKVVEGGSRASPKSIGKYLFPVKATGRGVLARFIEKLKAQILDLLGEELRNEL